MQSLRVLTVLVILSAAATSQAQITETPVTVRPGRFLLEMDAVSLSVDKEAGFKYTALGVASTFLTAGLTQNWDVQLGAQVYFLQKIESSGFTDRESGVGDMYVRTKWRFYDAGDTAVAIMPYVKLPTRSARVGSDALEGGVILPWTTVLPGGFQIRAMGELDLLRNDADDGYDTFWFTSMSMARPITSFLGLYGEATYGKSTGGAPAQGVMGLGATFHVRESIWWDYGMYKGISKGAADWEYVLRFNWGF